MCVPVANCKRIASRNPDPWYQSSSSINGPSIFLQRHFSSKAMHDKSATSEIGASGGLSPPRRLKISLFSANGFHSFRTLKHKNCEATLLVILRILWYGKNAVFILIVFHVHAILLETASLFFNFSLRGNIVRINMVYFRNVATFFEEAITRRYGLCCDGVENIVSSLFVQNCCHVCCLCNRISSG
jgi:hypothetical protein